MKTSLKSYGPAWVYLVGFGLVIAILCLLPPTSSFVPHDDFRVWSDDDGMSWQGEYIDPATGGLSTIAPCQYEGEAILVARRAASMDR